MMDIEMMVSEITREFEMQAVAQLKAKHQMKRFEYDPNGSEYMDAKREHDECVVRISELRRIAYILGVDDKLDLNNAVKRVKENVAHDEEQPAKKRYEYLSIFY